MAEKRWKAKTTQHLQEFRESEISETKDESSVEKLFYKIEVVHVPTGRTHLFELFESKTGRRDQFQIFQNGKEWKSAMGLTRFLRGLGAAMFGENAEFRAMLR